MPKVQLCLYEVRASGQAQKSTRQRSYIDQTMNQARFINGTSPGRVF